MTTILKAVQEIEARTGGTPPPATTSRDDRPPTSSRLVVRVLAALAVGIAIGAAAVAVRTSRSTPPAAMPAPNAGDASRVAAAPRVAPLPRAAPAPPVAAPPIAPPPAAPVDVAHEPPHVAPAPAAPAPRVRDVAPEAAAAEEPPWGRVEKKSAAAEARPAVAVPPPRSMEARAAEPSTRRSTAPAAEPPSRRDDAATRGDARASTKSRNAAGTHRSSAWTPTGLHVQVTAIDFAADASERTAALRIGDHTVRLRQGESASGLEVQLILPDAVYLRSGRDIFAVDAPR